ncbi:thiol reductant ABC exporter subunit CydD [Deinococcus knuensis]|uniref:Uncharacterized protein n=1 Tax=Deinococcus knuensis TaxID=1837380 RepID=A0ABQ2SH75_9DEIO|nr:thiol reductant ABC exporter subunit CydD [Deinococcus knuensis]GGS22058.1 hypothetical protein GCM10008961_11910 [Deinococcus knuensis]
MNRSPSPLRRLSAGRTVRAALPAFAALSVAGTAATAWAFVLIARVISDTLLPALHPAGLRADAGAATLPTMALIAALLGVRAATVAGREWLGARLAARMVGEWRARLTDRALALGPVALAGGPDGAGGGGSAALSALDSDLGPRLTPYYARFLPGAVHAGVAALGTLLVTAWLDPATAGVLLVTGPLTVVFLALVGWAAHAAAQRQWEVHTRLTGRLLNLTRSLPTLHLFGAVGAYRDVLDRSAAQHREATLAVLRVAFLSGFVMEFAATLSTALVAVWVGVRLFDGTGQLAPLLAALMLVPEFFGPLRQAGADRHAAMDAEPLARQLGELLGGPVTPAGTARVSGTPTLTLRGACADLGGGAPTRGTLSAVLTPGTHAALRGPSGSGKTTLLHALRKHVPHGGLIEVQGTPLDDLSARGWQQVTAFVPQHPRLIAGTVRENLRLWQPDADDAALHAAARAVGLDGLLGSLPLGWDTPLGEGGTSLSGGELARLALARVLVSGARVVLLDEVTAHLDPRSEQEVLRAIRAGLRGRTVLLATHRPPPPGWPVLTLDTPAGTPSPLAAQGVPA